MERTRDRILAYVVRTRGSRIEPLAEELGISSAAVRRHLDALRAEGLITVRTVKQATGRPYYLYVPTEEAFGELPEGYARLLEQLLPVIEQDETLAERLSSAIASELAARHAPAISAGSPGEAVAQVTESLRDEGILESWYESEDGYHMVNGTCPYLHAAELSRLPCEFDRQAIAMLIGGEVAQVQRIAEGAPVCEFVVRADDTPHTHNTKTLIPSDEIREGVR
jgi:predicted ArsR family transcriptional regulator